MIFGHTEEEDLTDSAPNILSVSAINGASSFKFFHIVAAENANIFYQIFVHDYYFTIHG